MLEKSRAHANLVTQIVPSPFTFRVDRTVQDLIADGYLGDLYAMTVRGLMPGFADPAVPLHYPGDLVRSCHALGWTCLAGIRPDPHLHPATPRSGDRGDADG